LSARTFSACSASVRQAARQIEAAGSGAVGGAPQALTGKHQKQELISGVMNAVLRFLH